MGACEQIMKAGQQHIWLAVVPWYKSNHCQSMNLEWYHPKALTSVTEFRIQNTQFSAIPYTVRNVVCFSPAVSGMRQPVCKHVQRAGNGSGKWSYHLPFKSPHFWDGIHQSAILCRHFYDVSRLYPALKLAIRMCLIVVGFIRGFMRERPQQWWGDGWSQLSRLAAS